MKITCQSCDAKFRLDDSKVQGRTKKFGIKCPTCAAVIVITPPGVDGAEEATAGASGTQAAPPPPSAPPPPPAAPSGSGGPVDMDDPFAGLDLEGGGGSPPPPPAAEEPPAPAGGGGDFDFGSAEADVPPPPSAAGGGDFDFGDAAPEAPPAPARSAGGGSGPTEFDFGDAEAPAGGGEAGGGDPFDFGAVDPGGDEPAGGGEAGGGDPFDFGAVDLGGDEPAGGGGEAAGGGFDFGDEEPAAPPRGGGGGAGAGTFAGASDLDELDQMDQQLESGGEAADDFFGGYAGGGASYRLKNPRGQVAGPFTVEAIREFAGQGKFTGHEEISRNDGPWVSSSLVANMGEASPQEIDRVLAEASSASAPEMSVGFSDEEMAAGGGKKVVRKGSKKPLILALVVVLLIGAGAGGFWFWWTKLRELPIEALTDQKIVELVKSGRTTTGEREQISTREYEKGIAVLDRYAVEEFPVAETAFLTAIQKDPSNHKAVAGLAWLQAEWTSALDERERAPRALMLASAARDQNSTLPEANLARAEAARVNGNPDEAIKYASEALSVNPKMVAAHVSVARAHLSRPGAVPPEVDAPLRSARELEREDQLLLLTLAEVFERREQFGQALEAYDLAISSRPKNAWPRYRKALLLNNLGRYDEANKELETAFAEADMNRLPTLKAKLLALQGQILLAKGDVESAEKAIVAAQQAGGRRPDVVTARGDLERKKEQLDSAITQYERAKQLDPDYVPAYVKLGKTRLYLREPTVAERELTQALQRDPNNVEARLLLGQALGAQKKYDEAREQFDKVIEAEPENATAYAQAGRMLAAQGEAARAQRMFLKAVELEPGNADVYLIMGQNAADLGQTDEAINYTRRAATLAPDNVAAKIQLGRLYLKKGAYQDAVKQLESALEDSPGNLEILIALARAERALKRFTSARDHLVRAKETKPTDAQIRFLLGRTYYDLGEVAQAQEVRGKTPEPPSGELFKLASSEFNRAVYYAQGERRAPEFYLWYGKALKAQNKLIDARDQLEEAIKLDSKLVDANFQLAEVERLQTNFAPAIRRYERVLELDPSHVPALIAIGTIIKDQEQKPEKALDYLERALRYDSRSAMAMLRICQIHLDARRFGDAQTYCKRAIAADRDLCEAYIELGFASDALRKSAEACSAWRTATRCTGVDPYRKEEVQLQINQYCQ